MADDETPTWWQEHHAFLQEGAEEGEVDAGPPFSPQLLDLLADVERTFAVTGADAPPWPAGRLPRIQNASRTGGSGTRSGKVDRPTVVTGKI